MVSCTTGSTVTGQTAAAATKTVSNISGERLSAGCPLRGRGQPPHLILFLQLQRLADPLQTLFVGEPCPLLAQTVFDVFGCGLEVKPTRSSVSKDISSKGNSMAP